LRNKEYVLRANTFLPPTRAKPNQSRNLKALKCREMETKPCAGTGARAETLCPARSYHRRWAAGVTWCSKGEWHCYTPWWTTGDTEHRPSGPSCWGYSLSSVL